MVCSIHNVNVLLKHQLHHQRFVKAPITPSTFGKAPITRHLYFVKIHQLEQNKGQHSLRTTISREIREELFGRHRNVCLNIIVKVVW